MPLPEPDLPPLWNENNIPDLPPVYFPPGFFVDPRAANTVGGSAADYYGGFKNFGMPGGMFDFYAQNMGNYNPNLWYNDNLSHPPNATPPVHQYAANPPPANETDDTGLIGRDAGYRPYPTRDFAGLDPTWNATNSWLDGMLGSAGDRPLPDMGQFNATIDIPNGTTTYNSSLGVYQTWNGSDWVNGNSPISFGATGFDAPGSTGTDYSDPNWADNAASSSGPTNNEPNATSSQQSTLGKIWQHTPLGALGHAIGGIIRNFQGAAGVSETPNQRAWGDRNFTMAGGNSYFDAPTTSSHFNYGTGRYEKDQGPGRGFSGSPNQGAEQQGHSPRAFGMNPTNEGGHSINQLTAAQQLRNQNMSPEMRNLLDAWAAGHTSIFQPGLQGANNPAINPEQPIPPVYNGLWNGMGPYG